MDGIRDDTDKVIRLEFRGEVTEEPPQEEPVPARAASGGNPGKGKKGSE